MSDVNEPFLWQPEFSNATSILAGLLKKIKKNAGNVSLFFTLMQ
jgi:hypothetical protein